MGYWSKEETERLIALHPTQSLAELCQALDRDEASVERRVKILLRKGILRSKRVRKVDPAEVARLYKAGVSINGIRNALRCSADTVTVALKKAGVTRTRHMQPGAGFAAFVAGYDRGLNNQQLAEKFGISVNTARMWRQRAGFDNPHFGAQSRVHLEPKIQGGKLPPTPPTPWALNIRFDQLRTYDCRFITSPTGTLAEATFCGQSVVPGSSFCPDCHAICYTPRSAA